MSRSDQSITDHPSIHPGMGANLFGDGCSFRVWAPNEIAVSVCIWRSEQMSQVSLAPKPSNSSYWSADVVGVVAKQSYQFLIENKGGDVSNPGGTVSRVDTYVLKDGDGSNWVSNGK
ncbi:MULTISPECIES: hypothetical protein [Leptolyngbya]|uniref:hypothetical protein n=1 Tax=Leptolyngbya TaxID=47251 RepID=UPI0016859ABE|nr:hypothetical protein [Leptolyngbya sp. FACHB-1624]MBD1856969.1 hypothetical protein [Leptolyngbya sp. FACHB-1624]